MTVEYCTFLLNGMTFGLAVSGVQEILRAQPLTRVPMAPPVISGLMNLRGQIVLGVDLRSRLGLPPGNASTGINVVVRGVDGSVAFGVDAIGDVKKMDERELEPIPDTVQGAVRDFTVGVFQADGDLLLILDLDALVRFNVDSMDLTPSKLEA